MCRLARLGQMVDIPAEISARFAAFHIDELQQFRVRLRHTRAKQIRDLLSRPDELDLETFNREVWRLETQVLVDGVSVPVGEIFDLRGMSESRRAELEGALRDNRLVFHGNSIWGSGTRVYGSSVRGS